MNILVFNIGSKESTVKLGIKELLNKEQIGFKELFTDYQLFYIINLELEHKLSTQDQMSK